MNWKEKNFTGWRRSRTRRGLLVRKPNWRQRN